jgi:hypothetical protein
LNPDPTRFVLIDMSTPTPLERRILECRERARERRAAAEAATFPPQRDFHLAGAAAWDERAERLEVLAQHATRLKPPAGGRRDEENPVAIGDVPNSRQTGDHHG